MFVYRLDEIRFVQEHHHNSAADALTFTGSAVPAGKIWTILSAIYYPNVAETRTIEFLKLSRTGTSAFALRVPQSIALSATIWYPLLTEGNQLILLPGERLMTRRDVATAGSLTFLSYQFIESDMPIARYIEPQRELSIKRRSSGFASRSDLGSARAVLGSQEAPEGGERGGGKEGGPLPI